MNREQRRKAAKKATKSTIDLSIEPPMVPDGAQFRIPVQTKVEGQMVTLCMATVVCPFIYQEPVIYNKAGEGEYEERTNGFIMKFGEKNERKVLGFDMSECLLMDIATVDEWKRCGIATVLMKELQRMFRVIATGARSRAGYELMIKCGFEATREGQLIWRRQEDAKENEKGLKEGSEEKGAEGEREE